MTAAARAVAGVAEHTPAAAPRPQPARLEGWGRYPAHEGRLCRPADPREAADWAMRLGVWAPRGAGRAYGDAAIGADVTLDLTGLDRFKGFDAATGTLRAEAGATLGDVIACFLPRGWFPKVVPGTRFVTLGGALAADVHGKNHHAEGGFAATVERFTLATPNDGLVEVTRRAAPDLFAATAGGMGLTGAVLDLDLRLRRVETGWIRQRTLAAENLGDLLRLLNKETAPYSVAWIDCLARGPALGRGLLFLGEHASAEDLAREGGREAFPSARRRRLGVPFEAPDLLLNPISMRAFNAGYFRKGARRHRTEQLVGWEPYFFPLDAVRDWNLLYGGRGFVQHQCVVPHAAAEAALTEILERVARRGQGSFLAVLKTLGGADGDLAFPLPGVTLTLDFPMRPDLPDFLDELDQVVARAGGRLYLAKDARQQRPVFDAGYPKADRFRHLRRALGAAGRVRSLQSDRLGL